MTKAMFLKGRISTSLEALTEALPKFAEKDLVIVQRKTTRACGSVRCGPRGISSPWRSCSALFHLISRTHT